MPAVGTLLSQAQHFSMTHLWEHVLVAVSHWSGKMRSETVGSIGLTFIPSYSTYQSPEVETLALLSRDMGAPSLEVPKAMNGPWAA